MINVDNIIQILRNEFQMQQPPTPINEQERNIANEIIGMIKGCLQATHFNFDSQEDLDFDDVFSKPSSENKEDTGEEDSPISSSSSLQSSCETSPVKEASFVEHDQMKKAANFYRSSKKPRRTLSSVQTKFRFVKSIRQLKEFEKLVQKQGSRRVNINRIFSATLAKFKTAKNFFLPQRL